MEWKSIKEHEPEEGRFILYGNHRFVDVIKYYKDHPGIKSGKLMWKDITHWCYIDLPPSIFNKPLWNKDDENKPS